MMKNRSHIKFLGIGIDSQVSITHMLLIPYIYLGCIKMPILYQMPIKTTVCGILNLLSVIKMFLRQMYL